MWHIYRILFSNTFQTSLRYVLSSLRIIVHNELGTTKTGVAGGVFKGIFDTAVEIPRKPTECVRVLDFEP